jgi:hypothetical protein
MTTTPTTARRRARAAAWTIALAMGVAGVHARPVSAATPASPRTAAVVVRALAYHRGLRELAGARLDLLVLTSTERTQSTNAAFERLANVAVQGLPLNVSVAVPAGIDELRVLIRSRHIEAIYVDALAPALHAPLRALAREFGVVVFSAQRADLATVAQVAVVDESDRARLVVSLPELRAARIELAADLLKLAEVVR